VTEEEGSLDIVREALESIRVESLPQSQAKNITCSHHWEGWWPNNMNAEE